MAKQEKIPFDYEEFFNDRLEEASILTWNTRHQAFTFAFYLNQLYGLNLERSNEVDIESKEGTIRYSIYTYISYVNQQVFFLVDIPAVAPTAKGGGVIFDKMLIILGPDALETGEHIYDETSQNRPGEELSANDERNAMLLSFVDGGIFESGMFDFSDPEQPTTTYFPATISNPTLQKRKTKFLKEQRNLVSDLILALDDLIPDFDS